MQLKGVYWIVIFGFLAFPINAQEAFIDWPAGKSPQEIGERVAERFVHSAHGRYNLSYEIPHIPYFEVCTWYGALAFAKASANGELAHRLLVKFDPLFTFEDSLLPVPDHVDYTMFGGLPLELYLQTGDEKYLELGLPYADKQWGEPFGPRVTDESRQFYDQGLTWQTRLWIDDMYMITFVQAQAYRATGDIKYLDRAAKEMVYYLDTLQRENGLFYHGLGSPFFWGRGNGWMAAGMTELLRVLPKGHAEHERILAGYRKMMLTLLSYQDSSGMWRQLINDPDSWEESSSTGMFTYAMVTGVKEGWLDEARYAPSARIGWLALTSQVNADGDVRNVCEGTGKGTERQYYLDRKRNTGDFHGQAPVLWCAAAFMR